MTPVEIRDALVEIATECGPKGYASVSISVSPYRGDPEVSATLYPEDIVGRHCISVKGETFSEAIANLRSAWDDKRNLADKNTIRKMALAIIEITGDQGECSDAALRGAGFYQPQIDRMGAMACEEATRLAAGGPFQIIATTGANQEAA